MSYDMCSRRWGKCPSPVGVQEGEHFCGEMVGQPGDVHDGVCKCSWCGATLRREIPRSVLPAVLGAMALTSGVGYCGSRSFDHRREADRRRAENNAAAIKRLENALAKRERKNAKRAVSAHPSEVER